MKPAQRHVGAAGAVASGDLIRAIRVRDVDLNDDQVRFVIEIELLDMLVLQRNLESRIEVRGQRGQSEGRKERVLDRPPEGTGRLRQRRKNELDAPDGPNHDKYFMLESHCNQEASYPSTLLERNEAGRGDDDVIENVHPHRLAALHQLPR